MPDSVQSNMDPPDEQNKGIDTQASGSRFRNDSECSATSDDGADRGKRHCSTPQFMIPGATAASPPKFVSLEEIMQAANGMRDMALVHQIVVDQDFKLAPAELPENSIQKQVNDTMRKVFWDILRQELNEDPPNYTQALVLMEDVRKGLFSVLLPQHTKIRQQIAEVLDTDLVKQQAEAGVLDFQHYAQFVISVMAKLCAPVRDEKIKELTETTDVVATFKGILETLDLMALDMANFTIKIARPDIIAQSVEWERKKFADFLTVQADGLEHTRKWLLRHFDPSKIQAPRPDDLTYVKNLTATVLSDAYMELLEWDESNLYPETLLIDEVRLKELQERTDRLVVIGAVLLVTASGVGSSLQSVTAFKDSLKQQLNVLLQSVHTERQLSEALPGIADHVVNEVKKGLAQHNLNPLSENSEKVLHGQIIDIGKTDHRIRQLVRVRLREFLHQIITSPTAAPQQVPTGLSSLQKELAGIAGQFLRIVSHNRAVFGQYYLDIVDAALKQAAA